MGGPRGSFIVPTEFDWHLLIGDDTALPAISRRAGRAARGARAWWCWREVDGPEDEIPFETRAALTLVWVHRRGVSAGLSPMLLETLKKQALPEGDYHAWVGCRDRRGEERCARTLVGERGANPKWIRASGYWRRGTAATHDAIED